VKLILLNLRKEEEEEIFIKKQINEIFDVKLPIDLSEVKLENPSINFDEDDDDVNQSGDKNG